MEIVRLGEGVDAHRPALRRRRSSGPSRVARFYAALAAEAGAGRVRFVATSASRDADNARRFVAGMHAICSASRPRSSPATRRRRSSFAGAVRAPAGAPPSAAPCLVVDVGGGSTEFVLGDDPRDGGAVVAARSVDVGCGAAHRAAPARPTRRPPAESSGARADVDAALDDVAAAVPLATRPPCVGLAGTVTTVTAHALGLPAYDAGAVHGARAARSAACARPAPTCSALTRASAPTLPYLRPRPGRRHRRRRARLGQVVERVHRAAGLQTVLASEHDILDGIAVVPGNWRREAPQRDELR